MFSSFTNLSAALVVMVFLGQASVSVAGHGRSVGHPHRSLNAGHKHIDMHAAKRAEASDVELPLVQLQMLQSEYTVFKEWMNTGFNDSAYMDIATYVAQLKQEFAEYDIWMSAWLNSALKAGSPSAPPAPVTSSLLPLPSVVASSSVVAVVAEPKASSTSSDSDFLQQKNHVGQPHQSPKGSTSSVGTAPTNHSPNPIAVSSSSKPSSSHSSYANPGPTPSQAPAASSSSSVAAGVAPTTAPATGGSSSGGSFNAAGSNNVAVYYGQTAATSQVKLSDLCADKGTDIIILAFLTTYFGPGGYPTVNFGSACGSSASSAAAAKGATGLLSCPDMAKDIQTCQSAGKKVLLSLGGAEATTAFTSDSQASTFATQLNNLFTGGSGEDSALRPFGSSVKLDGFDIDNEDHSTDHYSAFVTALRSAMDADTSKKYYISAAPQCPRPDASIPLNAMQSSMDFIFVQFYNNGDCNVGQPGFLDSFKAWSSDLSATGKGPKLFIGAPGCPACAGSGYEAPGAMESVIQSAKSAGVANFGGVMLWDGAEAVVNGNYQQAMKSALG